MLHSQVKCMGGSESSTVREDTEQDATASRERSNDECSTSYHYAQDISRADFNTVGVEFQVSTPCA